MMALVTLAWRNLQARWARVLTTMIGVALAVASFVALVGLARGIESTLLSALQMRGTDVIVTEAGALDVLSSIVPAKVADGIAATPGVANVVPELARMTPMPRGGSAIVVAWPPGTFPWETLDLRAGRLPAEDDREVAVIGTSLARRHGLAAGDSLELFHAEFRIIGVADSASMLTRNLVFVPIADAQRLTFRDGQATSLNVRLDPGLGRDARRRMIDTLNRAWPELAIETTESMVEGYTYARIAKVLSISISIVALVSAVLVVFNTIAMSVNERKGEFAIMSAIGWPRRRIVGCILLEGALIAVGAGVAGSLAGFAGAHLVMQVPAIAGFVQPQIDTALIVLSVAATLVVGIAGALLPALWATGQPPAEILRGR